MCVLPVKGDLLRAAALSVDNKSALLLAPICALPRSLAAAYIARSPLTRRPPGHQVFKGTVHRPTVLQFFSMFLQMKKAANILLLVKACILSQCFRGFLFDKFFATYTCFPLA